MKLRELMYVGHRKPARSINRRRQRPFRLERLEARRLLAANFLDGQAVGTVESALIDEASGTVASRQNQDVLWTHNDSGDVARLFAMDTQGRHLGIYNITGAAAVDWEDIAIGPGPQAGVDYLYIGDIGDNLGIRNETIVYRIAEPTVDAAQVPDEFNLPGAESITLVYPDGARDAESLLVDPLNGEMLVVTKREALSRVYRAAYPQSTSQTTTLEFMGELDFPWAVGGDVSPTGLEVLIKDGVSVTLYERSPAESLSDALLAGGINVPYTVEPQGEAITFDGIGQGYYTLSEGLHQPLYYYERLGESTSFQQGTAGYSGTVDTQLLEDSPDADYSSAVSLTIDADEPPDTNRLAQGLIRFESLFGDAPGQIPAGNQIVSARLQLNVTNPGTGFSLHRMLQNWADTDTFNGLAGGIQADDVEALAPADASTGAVSAGTLSIDVTASLTAWLANPAENLGWALLPSGMDGVDFDSSEGATPPKLVVTHVVAEPNDAPVIVSPPADVTVDEDAINSEIDVSGVFDDPNGDTLTLSVTGNDNPAVVSASLAGNTLTLDYLANQNGTANVTLRATDGAGAFVEDTLLVTVNAVNDPPTALDDDYVISEGATLVTDAAAGVLANDTDIENSSLTATLDSYPTYGLLTLDADGSFTYDPGSYVGVDTFTYKAFDGTDYSDVATVTITVGPVTIAEDSFDSGGFSGGSGWLADWVIAGTVAVDSTGAPHSSPYHAVLRKSNGYMERAANLDGKSDVTLSFWAKVDAFEQDDQATLSIFDGTAWSIEKTFTTADSDGNYYYYEMALDPSALTADFRLAFAAGMDNPRDYFYVDDVKLSGLGVPNDPPMAVDDWDITDEDSAIDIDVLDNDSDADGDPLSVAGVDQLSAYGATLAINPDGTIAYDPTDSPELQALAGSSNPADDTFSYTISDGKGGTDTATVTVTVTGQNDAPIAADDGYQTPLDTALEVSAPGLLSNDTDPDSGSFLNVSNVNTTGTSGQVTSNADGSFTYIPALGFSGTDSFTYTVRDEVDATSTATVTITVGDGPVEETFESTDTPLSIADPHPIKGPRTVTSEIDVVSSDNVGSLVVNVDIAHGAEVGLNVTLEGPSVGPQTLDYDGQNDTWSVPDTTPLIGQPLGGIWTLSVSDVVKDNVIGVLQAWSLVVVPQPAGAAAAAGNLLLVDSDKSQESSASSTATTAPEPVDLTGGKYDPAAVDDVLHRGELDLILLAQMLDEPESSLSSKPSAVDEALVEGLLEDRFDASPAVVD